MKESGLSASRRPRQKVMINAGRQSRDWHPAKTGPPGGQRRSGGQRPPEPPLRKGGQEGQVQTAMGIKDRRISLLRSL